MVIVTDKPCQPPKVSILDNSTINVAPKQVSISPTFYTQLFLLKSVLEAFL